MFEILIIEAFDWVNRDLTDVANFYKHLRFAGVTLVPPPGGGISELHVGFKCTMNARFLEALETKGTLAA